MEPVHAALADFLSNSWNAGKLEFVGLDERHYDTGVPGDDGVEVFREVAKPWRGKRG